MSGLLFRIFAVLALVGGALYGANAYLNYQQRIGEARATARYEKAINQQKAEAAALLAKETERATQIERSLFEFKHAQEMKDAQVAKYNRDQADRLRDLAGPIGRLRDPNSPTGCGGCRHDTEGEAAAASGAGAVRAAEAPGVLSEQLSGLLRRLASEADEVNAAYASCRADALAVRSAQP